MEIEGLNLVNQDTAVTPNYELDGRVNSIIAYLNIQNELLIIGWIDNNYIYWASKTKAHDQEINEQIFNRLANGFFETVSQTKKALESIGISYEELNRFYRECFDRGNEREPGKVWKISSGGYYKEADIQSHGRLFAYRMEGMLMHLQEKCRVREANGAYFKVLEQSLKILQKEKQDACYYEKEYELIQNLERESYLLLSKDERIRNIYFQIKEEIHSLYCIYMSAIK